MTKAPYHLGGRSLGNTRFHQYLALLVSCLYCLVAGALPVIAQKSTTNPGPLGNPIISAEPNRAGREARPLALASTGPPRALPTHLIGASVSPFFEHLLNDPQKIALTRQMHLGFVRFPGGSDANYYHWRTGLFSIEVFPNSSNYTRFWGKVMPNIRRGHPDGISLEQYRKFTAAIGAQVVLVPNLETSSVAAQRAWFQRLRQDGSLPTHIEMGNEFWVAMGNDSNVIKKWPDEPTTMRTTWQYLEALRPYFLPGSKVAIQSAGSSFSIPGSPRMPFGRRLKEWDEHLKPEPWFDAVTLHLYPHLKQVLGRAAPTAPEELKFRAMMARVDGGVERVLRDTERRLPGKEIWITEWNPRGVDHTQADPFTAAENMHLVTKMTLAYLRHPAVTMSLFFMLSYSVKSHNKIFLPGNEGTYLPTPTAVVLRWFNEAANGGSSYQGYLEPAGRRISGSGLWAEDFVPIEAALFRAGDHATLIVQNATPEPRSLDLTQVAGGAPLVSSESLATPDLYDRDRAAVSQQQTGQSSGPLLIPAYSVCRLIFAAAPQVSALPSAGREFSVPRLLCLPMMGSVLI